MCAFGDRIIEIGANIGTETVGFADIVGKEGKVYAFEPFPNNVKALQENVALNGYEQVTIFPQAVGAIRGKVKFVCPPDEHASGIGFVANNADSTEGPVIEVECVTLDALRQMLGPCRAIFMDVEGAEIDILRGGTSYLQEFQPIIVLEASPKTLQRAGCSDPLRLDTMLNEVSYVFLTFLANTFQVLQDSLDRASAHVAIALMGTLGIVLDQPASKVGLEGLHGLVERGAKGNPKELI